MECSLADCNYKYLGEDGHEFNLHAHDSFGAAHRGL